MKISAKSDYACRAILELSLHWPSKEPLSLRIISKNQEIPMKFLTQILLHLKHLGLVISVRGQQGGYLLAKAPSKITLTDVLANELVKNPANVNKVDHVIEQIWLEAEQTMCQFMDQITFENILQREKSKGKVPMYTI